MSDRPTSIRMPKELMEEVDRLSHLENRSRSNMIVELIKEALAIREVEEAQRDAWLLQS